jgi:hypothetical protein
MNSKTINKVTFYSKPTNSNNNPLAYVLSQLDALKHTIIIKDNREAYASFETQDKLHVFISENKSHTKTFYEILIGPQYMFAELNIDDISKRNIIDICSVFSELIKDVFNELELKFDSKNVKWLSINTENNSFIRFIYQDEKVFESYIIQKKFWLYVNNFIKTNRKYDILKNISDENDEYSFSTIIDLSVYSEYKTIRLVEWYREDKENNGLLPFRFTESNGKKEIKLDNRNLTYNYFINYTRKSNKYYSLEIPEYESLKYSIDKDLLADILKNKLPKMNIAKVNYDKITLDVKFDCEDPDEFYNPYLYFTEKAIKFTDDTKTKLIYNFEEDDTEEEETKYYFNDYHKLFNRSITKKELAKYFISSHVIIENGGNFFYMTRNLDELGNDIWTPVYKLSTFSKDTMVNVDGKVNKLSNFISEFKTNIISKYTCVNYFPYFKQSKCLDHVFNLFSGFSRVNKKFKYNKEKVDDILDYIKYIVCNGVEENYDYLIKYYAHMIQKPNEKMPIGIIHNIEGNGKNRFYEFLSNVIDKNNNIFINKLDDLSDDFMLINKLLVILDDVVENDIDSKSNMLVRTFISKRNKQIKFGSKGTFNFNRLSRFISLSNKLLSSIEPNDKQYFICNGNNDDSEYFTKLEDVLDNESVADSFFRYLSKVELKEWNYTNIPKTKVINEVKVGSELKADTINIPVDTPLPIIFIIDILRKNRYLNEKKTELIM